MLAWTGVDQSSVTIWSGLLLGTRKAEAQETIDGDVTGGSYANVVCGLSFSQGMIHHRIVICKDSPLCAVLFWSSITRDTSLDAEDIQVYDTSTGKMVESREGRDIVIMSSSKAGED